MTQLTRHFYQTKPCIVLYQAESKKNSELISRGCSGNPQLDLHLEWSLVSLHSNWHHSWERVKGGETAQPPLFHADYLDCVTQISYRHELVNIKIHVLLKKSLFENIILLTVLYKIRVFIFLQRFEDNPQNGSFNFKILRTPGKSSMQTIHTAIINYKIRFSSQLQL